MKNFEIKHRWDGEAINHRPVKIELDDQENGLKLTIDAPFFGDPPPGAPPAQSTWQLWDFEVVEAFFLNSSTGQYLELEFGPHGHFLGILFKKRWEFWKKHLPLNYSATIEGNAWVGEVSIPWDYLPQDADKFNGYAIHGCGESRTYEALFPTPKEKFSQPDFHRLEYFGNIKELFRSGVVQKSNHTIWEDS